MRRLAILVLAIAPSAQAKKPVASEALSGPVAEIVAAERAFSKRCGEVGLKKSFLEFFAADGLSFAPDPGPAAPRLQKMPDPPTPLPAILAWAPEQAEVAASGDLGWTTGPFMREDKTGKTPSRHGYYFSLWRKQPDGSWKVVLDLGVMTPATPLPARAVAVGATSASKRAATDPDDPATIQKRDEDFCREAAVDSAKAYAAALAQNGRVHREGVAPMVGEKAWRAWTRTDAAKGMRCRPMAAFAAAGLGYAYGSWEHPSGDHGFYVRVWRRESAWRIAVDVAAQAK